MFMKALGIFIVIMIAAVIVIPIVSNASEQTKQNLQVTNLTNVVNEDMGNLLLWWDTNWNNRTELYVTNNNTANLTDYQIEHNVTWRLGMQNDFDDLRFVQYTISPDTNISNDVQAELPYWIEEKVNGSYAFVHVKATLLPNGTGTTIYMYWSNDNATGISNCTATMEFCDEFNDNTIGNGTSWIEVTTACAEDNGTLYSTDATPLQACWAKVASYDSTEFRIVTRSLHLNNDASFGEFHYRLTGTYPGSGTTDSYSFTPDVGTPVDGDTIFINTILGGWHGSYEASAGPRSTGWHRWEIKHINGWSWIYDNFAEYSNEDNWRLQDFDETNIGTNFSIFMQNKTGPSPEMMVDYYAIAKSAQWEPNVYEEPSERWNHLTYNDTCMYKLTDEYPVVIDSESLEYGIFPPITFDLNKPNNYSVISYPFGVFRVCNIYPRDSIFHVFANYTYGQEGTANPATSTMLDVTTTMVILLVVVFAVTAIGTFMR